MKKITAEERARAHAVGEHQKAWKGGARTSMIEHVPGTGKIVFFTNGEVDTSPVGMVENDEKPGEEVVWLEKFVVPPKAPAKAPAKKKKTK